VKRGEPLSKARQALALREKAHHYYQVERNLLRKGTENDKWMAASIRRLADRYAQQATALEKDEE
jgi:hypothetical protein